MTFSFTSDGRYTYTSGTLLTGASSTGTGQDGSSGAVSTDNGGASFGPNGTNSSAASSNQDAGTYAIDGFTLELRSKAGKLTRTFAFAWDEGKYKDRLVIGGVTFTPPKK